MDITSTGDDPSKKKELNEPVGESKSDLYLVLQELTTEIRQVHREMRILSGRVDKLTVEAGGIPPARPEHFPA